MNKRGNILINSVLTLTLSSIVILNISRTTVQSSFVQNTLFEREIVEDFSELENIIDKSIYDPIVDYTFVRFNEKYATYNKSVNNASGKLRNDLKNYMTKTTSLKKDLDCDNPKKINYKSEPYRDILVVCQYDKDTTVEIRFTFTNDSKQGKDYYSTLTYTIDVFKEDN